MFRILARYALLEKGHDPVTALVRKHTGIHLITHDEVNVDRVFEMTTVYKEEKIRDLLNDLGELGKQGVFARAAEFLAFDMSSNNTIQAIAGTAEQIASFSRDRRMRLAMEAIQQLEDDQLEVIAREASALRLRRAADGL